MRTIKEEFKILYLISKGTSGEVHKVIHKQTNKIYAMKTIENVNSELLDKI
jgi:hypothetical protein